MRKIKTLKKNYEFQNVLTKGKFYIGKQITIYIAENKRQINQIGIAISKKTCNAVKRNHIKRKIRENYTSVKVMFCGRRDFGSVALRVSP